MYSLLGDVVIFERGVGVCGVAVAHTCASASALMRTGLFASFERLACQWAARQRRKQHSCERLAQPFALYTAIAVSPLLSINRHTAQRGQHQFWSGHIKRLCYTSYICGALTGRRKRRAGDMQRCARAKPYWRHCEQHTVPFPKVVWASICEIFDIRRWWWWCRSGRSGATSP